MIQFDQVTVRRGPRVLFENASFTLPYKAKVGLIGQNGSGKSSLFAVLQHQLTIDQGNYLFPKKMRIAHIEQETPAFNCSALDYVLDGDSRLRQLQQELCTAENSNNALKIAELHQNLHAIDGYSADARAARLLNGLGFAHQDNQKSVSSFSGGWRMRLNLAQALMKPSDLLLLDEPTNHLDLNTIIWLERYLQLYPGMLIIISHDRDFLDKVISHTLHINQESIDYYLGNYSQFEKQRAEKITLEQATHKKIMAKRQHLQSFIDRFKAKASKARQAQSRVKALEKLAQTQVTQVSSPFQFSFGEAPSCPSPMVIMDKLQLGYNQHTQLQGITLTLATHDRIGLIGVNGAGKSTLLKSICQTLIPQQGSIHIEAKVSIGYFAQHQIDELNNNQSPFEHLSAISEEKRQTTDQYVRNFLGGFNFQGERIFEPLEQFSGGEKARFALAKIIWKNPNLLILDEPTNHLDIDMCNALNFALQEFNGTLILVSHNRHLLNSCTDQLWVVNNGKISDFSGSLDEYIQQFSEKNKENNTVKSSTLSPPSQPNQSLAQNNNKKYSRKEAASLRTKRKPFVDQLKHTEQALEALQTQLTKIEEKLTDNQLYQNSHKAKLDQLLIEQTQLKKQLDHCEEEVFSALEALENFDQGIA
ncbi:ABC-F family ATP-binding cassette domain-containing protein [Piscirickettsia salmonis]|uniref:ABC-F family ATP-binding cassette domain-containing protein n=1 Tax=Piscirickettsia salmonis TaxID=1238 RepID=UPI0007C902DB|nr:putative ABC transporter ATP-binding protein YheS [Piscirickettsiaceae bacterium NZ-RLO1]